MADLAADVVIVGSGPIGTACAIELASRGRSVTILERGVAETDPAGSHLRNQEQFRADPDAFFPAVGAYLTPIGHGAADSAIPGVFDAALVGGQGTLWTNNCPRAEPFERWDALSPEDWDARYARAERLLGVSGNATETSGTGQRITSRLAPALATAGRSLRTLPLAGHIDGTFPHFYAPHDLLARAPADARARITIRPQTHALWLVHDGGTARGVTVEGPDGTQSLSGRAVIVAGGIIGTPTLLHRSGIQPAALGRGLSFHQILFGQIVLHPDLAAPTGADDVAPRLYIPPTAEKPWHTQVLRDTCPLAANEAVDNAHRLLEFQAFLPVAFQDSSALVLSETAPPRFAYTPTEADAASMAAMRADVEALAAELGRWRDGCEPVFLPAGNHLVGTCRQDTMATHGVADRSCRVHGFDNLFLASLGLIAAPTAVNPTLTALALSLAACDAIANT